MTVIIKHAKKWKEMSVEHDTIGEFHSLLSLRIILVNIKKKKKKKKKNYLKQ